MRVAGEISGVVGRYVGRYDNRWHIALRDRTPKNEIAKLEYILSVQLKAGSDPEGSRRPDEPTARDPFGREQVVRPPSTPWEVGLPRGRGRQEPQHYAQ